MVHDLERQLGEGQKQILRWEFELIPWVLEQFAGFLLQGKTPNATARLHLHTLLLDDGENPNSLEGRRTLLGIDQAQHVKNGRGHD